ncbi:MAG: hypothetical protein GXP26_18390 [Planctomycetes bacterium]|nr:hypothetical protein [Planctomycetota bacterium]
MKKLLIVEMALLGLMMASVRADAPGSQAGISAKAPGLTSVELGDIKVEGEIGRRIDAMLEENLLRVDMDGDFLSPFLNQETKNKYIGMGKMLLALVQYEKYTGGKPEVSKLKNHVLSTLAETQGEDGYIGLFNGVSIPKRMTEQWSSHELSYITQGFVQDYLINGNKESLEVAKKAADFLLANFDQRKDKSIAWWKVHFLGQTTAMIWLYEATGDKKYLDFVNNTLEVPHWDPAIQSHTYTHLSHNLEQLYLYRITKDPNLLKATDKVIHFISEGDGMLATGGVSLFEQWHSTQECNGKSAESCATAYMLRLLSECMLIEPRSIYGDMNERIIHNALKASQSPDGRRLRYFTPAEGPRKYYEKETYCCPNNLRRIMPEISTMIYYSQNDEPGLIVDQYIPSEGQVVLSDGTKVGVKQVTDYPSAATTAISIDPEKAMDFSVQLRIPSWCGEKASQVYVNDELLEDVVGGQYYKITRNWKKGDVVRVKFPFDWHVVKGRKNQSGTYAVMRGPTVYAINPEYNEAMSRRVPPQTRYRITIDPDTLKTEPPKVVDGVEFQAATVDGWSQWWTLGPAGHRSKPDLKLTLTEFADPGGEWIYFRIKPGSSRVVEDELFVPKAK